MAELKPRNHRWPNPRRGTNGEPARLQRIFSVRVEPEITEKAESWIEKTGWTKRQLVEFALEEVFEKIDEVEAKRMRANVERALSPA